MTKPGQKIEDPNTEDTALMDSQRKWVCGHYAPETEHQYHTITGKLNLLDTILRQKWIAPAETVKLQCLGIALGDALAQQLGMKWVAVEDELGRSPALWLEGTTIILFPHTMISKRIERGDGVDVYELFNDLCGKVGELKKELTELPPAT
ncbi:MAG: hypothetical protein C0404_12935 [Verrucomicrobia bacterium]|nr:hypothetical protein [Verrucomicrobiota bacterium]